MTGLRPFQTTTYLAVAVPGTLIAAARASGLARARADVGRHAGATARTAGADSPPRVRARRQTSRSPWLGLVAAAVALELIGLALGGRSTTVPTLSDVLDRILSGHLLRTVTFVAWLGVGTVPLTRWRPGRRRQPWERRDASGAPLPGAEARR